MYQKKLYNLLIFKMMKAKTIDKNEIKHFIQNVIDFDKPEKFEGFAGGNSMSIYFIDLNETEESCLIFNRTTGVLSFKGKYTYFISNPFFKFDISKWNIELTETEKILKCVI